MKPIISNRRYILSTFAIALSAFASAAFAMAWQDPGTLPPGGNVATPINVSTTDQFKQGTFGAYILNIYGSSQYLNFGGTTGSAGFGLRNSAGALEFKGSGGTWGSLTILGNGNVGIGTTSPASVLEVQGSGNSIRMTDTGTVGPSSSGFIVYQNTLPTAVDQRTGYVISGSNLGGTARNAAALEFKSGGAWTDGVSYPTYIDFATTASGATSRTERMRIDASGNVGIGTTSPSVKVDVAGGTEAIYSRSTVGGSYTFLGNTGTYGRIGAYSAAAGWQDLILAEGGNVGIGTTAPGQKLTVAGTIESTRGGVKFPDGTVQTTASSGSAPSGTWCGYAIDATSIATCNGSNVSGGICPTGYTAGSFSNLTSANLAGGDPLYIATASQTIRFCTKN